MGFWWGSPLAVAQVRVVRVRYALSVRAGSIGRPSRHGCLWWDAALGSDFVPVERKSLAGRARWTWAGHGGSFRVAGGGAFGWGLGRLGAKDLRACSVRPPWPSVLKSSWASPRGVPPGFGRRRPAIRPDPGRGAGSQPDAGRGAGGRKESLYHGGPRRLHGGRTGVLRGVADAAFRGGRRRGGRRRGRAGSRHGRGPGRRRWRGSGRSRP